MQSFATADMALLQNVLVVNLVHTVLFLHKLSSRVTKNLPADLGVRSGLI